MAEISSLDKNKLEKTISYYFSSALNGIIFFDNTIVVAGIRNNKLALIEIFGIFKHHYKDFDFSEKYFGYYIYHWDEIKKPSIYSFVTIDSEFMHLWTNLDEIFKNG